MTIEQVLASCNLDKSVLVGYYGGGNYGDELLLEVLANRLKSHGVQDATITYQNPGLYQTYHHDFGYPLIEMSDKLQLLQAVAKNRNIIVGGGGLWGLDVNPSILLMGSFLLASKLLLRKKIYLLGVGYYNSTPWYGRVAAWLAGKSATHIVARDPETLRNFQKVTNRVSLDNDIAWLVSKIDLQPYQRELVRLNDNLLVKTKTLFITLRRFKPTQKNQYAELIEQYLASQQGPAIIALMEPQSVDPAGYALIRDWQKKYKNIQIADFSWNPLALFLFFQEHREKLALVGPQFHTIITAHLSGVPFLPIAYDNKVSELLQQIGQANVLPIRSLTLEDVQAFAGTFYEGGK